MARADQLHIDNGTLSLGVSPSLGGSLTYLRGATDILRPYTGSNDPRDSASFAMVPFANRIGWGRFKWHTQEYTLTPNMPPNPHWLHGEGWQSNAWRVQEHTQNSITLTFDYARPTNWPFRFSAETTYTLESNRMTATIRVTNHEGFEVPLTMGLHPYFPKTEHTRVYAQVEGVVLVAKDELPYQTTNTHKLLDALNEGTLTQCVMDNSFTGWNRECLIQQLGYQLHLRGSEIFSHLHCYTPPKNFFCAEPVTHPPNAIAYEPHNLIQLAGHAHIEGSVTFTYTQL